MYKMKGYRLFSTGLALGILVTAGMVRLFSVHDGRGVNATVGDVTIDQSVGGSSTLGIVTAQKLVDTANSAYFVDPAATGNALVVAGAATVSGQFTAANTFTFKSVSSTELGLYDSTNTLLVSFDEGN